MCVNLKDCELNAKVDEILKKQENLEKNQEDLRKDFDNMNKLVNTHNDIITKIDTKVQDGVYIGVEKALKGLDERVGSIVKREIKDNEYERMKADQERKKGFMDHGIKSLIGWAVVGLAGVILVILLGSTASNNNDLKSELSKIQITLDEQSKTILQQKDLLYKYEAIIKELQKGKE